MKSISQARPKSKLSLDFVAAILLCLSVVGLFLPVFLKFKGIFHNDQAIAEFVRQYFLAQNLQKGIIPLWDPHLWCGAIPYYSFPYSGNSYYALLWPFNLFADLNNVDKAYWMLTILPLMFHYILAAFGMYLLLHSAIKCNRFSSFVGAIAYIYSPVLAYSYVWTSSLTMQSWLPWLILIYIKAVRDFRLWKLLLGAVIFSFIWLGSKLQYMQFIMAIWGGFIILFSIRSLSLRKPGGFIRPFLIAGAIFILGTLLSAPFLYSFLDGLRYTELGFKLNIDSAVSDPAANLPFSYLATLFVPDLFGNITGRGFIFQRFMFFYANMSAGAAITFAAILGALLPIIGLFKTDKDNHFKKYAILGISLYIFSILCSLGGNTPFYKLVFGWIPFIGGLPNPIRFRSVQCFAASLLIAIGLSSLVGTRLFIQKIKLNRFVWFYIVISFCIVGTVLFLPQEKNKEELYKEESNLKIDGFLPLRQPVGIFTPRLTRVVKLRMMFDGESEGEIRYSDDNMASPSQGTLSRKYYILGPGWAEFDVDIPPNRFLWVCPQSGPGKIGYWKSRQTCFNYNNAWVINAYYNAVSLTLSRKFQESALFIKMMKGYIDKAPVVRSLLFWLFTLSAIVAGSYLLSARRFGYFLGSIVLLECFVFGLMAFYGGTFNEYATRTREFMPHNVRSLRPSDHPMFEAMIKQLPAIATEEKMRIATDYPFYNNYSYLNARFSFMGEPPNPLEKRFKQAIDTAYGENIRPCMFYDTGGGYFPERQEFLSNFSVGYFLSRSSEGIFEKEKCVPIQDNKYDFFVHINQNAMPRVYVMDRIICASDAHQFNELLSGDLRRAVYLSNNEGLVSSGKVEEDYVTRFEILQSKNPVKTVNYNNPNRIDIEVSIDNPSMLVLTEVWFPGWVATVDGKPEKIFRVNYCQRGVWLRKGEHCVMLEFKPRAWRNGIYISLGTMALMAGLLLAGRKRNLKTPGKM